VTDRAISCDQAVGVLRDYIRAKDENRPHLMREVFRSDALVEITAEPRRGRALISFPPRLQGLEAITATLVSDFGGRFENIYTFYLGSPARGMQGDTFSCDWLVAMTAKGDATVRVGCGRYRWQLAARPAGRALVQSLRIDIFAMQALAAEDWPAVQAWIAKLGYPWTQSETVLNHWPEHLGLEPVREYLARAVPA
jgi:hypothetical protein